MRTLEDDDQQNFAWSQLVFWREVARYGYRAAVLPVDQYFHTLVMVAHNRA